MKIYTRAGDEGITSLYGGKRISKSDIRIESCGAIDELSSYIGLIISKSIGESHKRLLTEIQKKLYLIMSFLSGAKTDLYTLVDQIKLFEQQIDLIQSKQPEIHGFILPQGTEIACLFHIVRTICRRAERNTVKLFLEKKTVRQFNTSTLLSTSNLTIVKYFNRLSDLFFVMARHYNTEDVFV